MLVEEGAKDIELGQLVAILVEDEDDVAAFKDYVPDNASAPEPAAAPAAEPTPAPVATSRPATSVQSTPAAPAQPSGDRIFASPLAKKLATESGIDLGNVTPTGPNG